MRMIRTATSSISFNPLTMRTLKPLGSLLSHPCICPCQATDSPTSASKPQQGDSLPKSTSATKAYETEKSTDKSEINPPEKRMETSSPDIMNVNHHDEAVYMSMTEHELLKSTKATKIKNIRVATQYSRDLARALGYLTEDMERVDMKTIRARSRKDRTRSRAYKGKLHPTDF
ncbi:hypothetical protein BC939DRAFT_54429 [Gamsiella multidivaricata]|uniref:uncharacterized protein n=1 Tax=Gamsiella multidivaricata TaxID=101098 RepID=UPI00221F0214|nr:uncharacterized protein BC939DRAFT_54429 [Gamsiella multidivaricata]KAI7816269.1 hypothetical protein BC939DRAFT_54429 [Gamsiella multidivaricata]